MTKAYDLIIIGGGPGGYVAAIRAGQLGLSVALVEKDKTGGTCLHRGCIPTKALIQSLQLYRQSKELAKYGIIQSSPPQLDTLQIHKRKQEVVDKLHRGISYLLKKNRVEVINGEGRLFSGNGNKRRVRVFKDDKEIGELESPHIILATGSEPLVPSWCNHDGHYIMTSDDILNLQDIPESLIIIGGGPVGLEFAWIFNTMGTKVTVLEMKDTLLPGGEEDICKTLERSLKKQGIGVLTSASVDEITVQNGQVNVIIREKESTRLLKAERALIAIGRRPSIPEIGPPGNIEMEGPFIRTDKYRKTSTQGIYAIGDITGPPLLAHKASYEGIIAVEAIADKEPPAYNPHIIPGVTYTYPQVASIGLTGQQAREKGYDIKESRFPFSANSMAMIEGEVEGFIKFIVDRKYGELLGVHMIGPRVSELIGPFSPLLALNATYMDITSGVFPHPSLSEVIKETAHGAGDGPIHI